MCTAVQVQDLFVSILIVGAKVVAGGVLSEVQSGIELALTYTGGPWAQPLA